MDAFKKILGNTYECQRCGFKIKSYESPYRCIKCNNLNKLKMDKIYFETHNDEALNNSSKS